MSLNVSSIHNGKAQELQPHSVRALLASLVSVSSVFGVALTIRLLTRLSPKLAVVFHPRQRLLRCPYMPSSRSSALIVLRWLVDPPDRSLFPETGLEGVMFLHYLRSLCILFGSLGLWVTPSMACFNALAPAGPRSGDWLNMLSWTNLSTQDIRLYWLYAIMVPLTAVVVLYCLSRGLAQAVVLRGQALTAERQVALHQRARMYYVMVSNVPAEWDDDQIRALYSRWDHHIERLDRLSDDSRMRRGMAQVNSILRWIERRETSFITRMLSQSKQMHAARFSQYLMQEIGKRYTLTKVAPTGRIGARWTSMGDLYSRLNQLTSSLTHHRSSSAPSNGSVSLLLSVNDYCAARAMADYPQSGQVSRCRARFLGPCARDVILANLGYAWSRHEVQQKLVQVVVAAMVLLWTVPMALAGALSQLSVVLQLLPSPPLHRVPGWLVAGVQGVAPALATSLLLSLFPWLLRSLQELAAYPTHGQLQLSTYHFSFGFSYLHLLLTPSISSGLVPTVFAVLNGGVTGVPRVLAANLPLAGNYYLAYLLIQCVYFASSTLFRPWALLQLYRASRAGQTPRDRTEFLRDLFFRVRWGELYPFYNVLAVIVLTYSLLTPFILPIATTTFGITYMCFRSLLCNVARVEADTRGQLYFQAWFGLFWGLYTQQATMIGLCLLKLDARRTDQRLHGFGQLMMLLLTFFFTVQYHWSLSRLYGPLMQHQEGTILEPTAADPVLDPCNEQHPHASNAVNASNPLDNSDAPDTSGDVSIFDATSTDGWASIEQVLYEDPPIIWLPRDSAGVSQALVEQIRSGPLAGSSNVIQVTDAPNGITWSGRPSAEDTVQSMGAAGRAK
ncbi:hypothetical protein LTR51_008658 [Lithohypha guttulata]|nr:hypothetical protein LTR51_008658 [Lithohypha guttulata]